MPNPRHLSALFLAVGLFASSSGCVGTPGASPDTGMADRTSVAGDACGAHPAVLVAAEASRCTWTTNDPTLSYIALDLDLSDRPSLNFVTKNILRWESSSAIFVHGLVGEGHNGRGFTGFWQSQKAATSCGSSEREFADCPATPFAKEDSWRFSDRPPAGRYVVVVAAYGAGENTLSVDLAADASFDVETIGAGQTEVAMVAEATGTPGAGSVAIHVQSTAWIDVSMAGDITPTRVQMTHEGGDMWTFKPIPGTPRWLAPTQWGDNVSTSNPNLALGPGTWTISATWQTSSDPNARPGVPVVGIIRDPFFVEADGRLRPYGPYEASA